MEDSNIYQMKNRAFKCMIAGIVLSLTSCIVQSPKYTSVEQVMNLKLGMSRSQLEDSLGIQPYNLKSYNDTSKVYIYVYRLTDRRTIYFNTKPVNGKKTTGRYVQLEVTYSLDSKVVNIESCTLCPDNLVTTSKIDFEKIIVFVTITLPVLLVYFGLKQ